MKNNKKTVIILLAIAIFIAIIPIITMSNHEYIGTDDAGSQTISEITGEEYEPWATPLIENIIGGELPTIAESLLFGLQTLIGVCVIIFFMRRLIIRERNKDFKIRGDINE